MADYRAIMAVSEATKGLLRTSYRAEDFNNELEFEVFTSNGFTNNTISNGASLFMYCIYCNGAHRTPPGRIGPDQQPLRSVLPEELVSAIRDATLGRGVEYGSVRLHIG